jgi:hypothetical protein
VSPTQWALAYLAAGAIYLAARWHLTEREVFTVLGRFREDNPDLPVQKIGAVAILTVLLLALIVWPVAAGMRLARTWRR